MRYEDLLPRLEKIEYLLDQWRASHNYAFGEISFQDSATTLTLTNESQYYPIASWTTNQNGQGVTPNYSEGTLTIGTPGWYLTICVLSMQSGNNLNFKAGLFVNGSLHPNGKVQYTTSGITGTPIIGVTIIDNNTYNAGDVLSVGVECTNSTNTVVTPLQGNFLVARVG